LAGKSTRHNARVAVGLPMLLQNKGTFFARCFVSHKDPQDPVASEMVFHRPQKTKSDEFAHKAQQQSRYVPPGRDCQRGGGQLHCRLNVDL
jgi:hypothetical protein